MRSLISLLLVGLGLGLVALVLRRVFVRGRRAVVPDLRGRRCVVTGASPGTIGFETARQLAEAGAEVIVSARSSLSELEVELRESLPQPARSRILAMRLDLVSPASVRAFAEAVDARFEGELDVLVNNAGIHLDLLRRWSEPVLTDDGEEIHFRTNYLGTVQLTEALLPSLLRASTRAGSARIVFVVSHLHRLARNADLERGVSPYDSWRAYGRSKLALLHATRGLDRRHAAEGVRSVALHPGSVYSRIADRGLEESRFLLGLRRVLAPLERFILKSTDEGAQTTLHCATAPSIVGGGYYEDCRLVPPSREVDDLEAGATLDSATRRWSASLPQPVSSADPERGNGPTNDPSNRPESR